MTRAHDLFELLEARGEAAIDDLIEERASEELFLDFKRSSDNGAGRRLSDRDRNNLIKAISGFANSAGGVIVWGVDCSPDDDNADVARAKHPIQNVVRYVSNLQGAISGATIPVVNTVRHHPIARKDGTGFVVTLIPESQNAPHQVVGKNVYYIRAGSDFVPAPHQVLAGMFGRRPQPNVYAMFTVNPAADQNGRIILQYDIVVTNGGPGIASDVFCTAMVIEAFGEETQLSWELLDNENWTGHFVFGRQISIMSRPEFRLPPKAFLTPLRLRIEVQGQITEGLNISGNLGCSGAPPWHLEISRSPDQLRQLQEEYLERREVLTQADRHRIATDFLGPPQD